MSERPGRLLIDGMNVLGSRPDGWWRDRPAAMERLVRRLEVLGGREVAVIFDGRKHERVAAAAARVRVGFASGGRDAADREIIRILHADPDPETITVASSDRRLRAAAKAAGARGISSGELLGLLRSSEQLDGDRDRG